MGPLEALAFYVKQAASPDGYRHLAARAGIDSRRFEYVFRAGHPNKEMPSGKLSPVMHGNLLKLMRELRLTIAPADDTVPTVAHICMMIDRMESSEDGKAMAKAAVHAAGLLNRPRGGLGE